MNKAQIGCEVAGLSLAAGVDGVFTMLIGICLTVAFAYCAVVSS